MTKLKKKNKLIIFICSIILFFQYVPFLYADEAVCKKFDIKCKTKKLIEDTKEFQKKGLDDGKKQLNKTKDKLTPKK
tara:strand:- start:309 stop:539 length:231 start_codon:yes stop_codon:yes gene_type:complete